MRLIALAPLLCGCATSMQLWQPRPAAMAPQGRVSIKLVVNKRPPGKGADDWPLIGQDRPEPDRPVQVRFDDPRIAGWVGHSDVPQMLTRFTSDALVAASIGLAQPGEPGPGAQLAIELHEMWCDGWARYGGAVSIAWVELDGDGREVGRIPLRREGGGIHCLFAYQKALTLMFDDLVKAFTKPEIRALLLQTQAR